MSEEKWEVVEKTGRNSGKALATINYPNKANTHFREKSNDNKAKPSQVQILQNKNAKNKKSRSMSPHYKDAEHTKVANGSSNVNVKEKNAKRKSIPVVQVHHTPKPKNIAIELANLDLDALKQTLAAHKESFPESKLIWLKCILSYLNSNLHLETDATFGGKPFHYPCTIVPRGLKLIIYDTLTDARMANVQYFFDQTLTTLAVDLSRVQGCLGHKVLLQLIAMKWPSVCVGNLAKSVILRNSYENRAAIGLALLWALGQGGYQDVNIGIKVWLDLMTPVVEMKAYTKFVCEYLLNVLRHAMRNEAAQQLTLSRDDLFSIVNTIQNGFKIPREHLMTLNECVRLLFLIFIRDTSAVTPFFVCLLQQMNSNNEQIHAECLLECILKDLDCLKAWRAHYKKHNYANDVLLAQISRNAPELRHSNGFDNFLEQILGESKIVRKKHYDAIHNSFMEMKKKNQQEKSQKKSKSSSSSSICPWLFGSVLLFGVIGGLLAYDTQRNGGIFEKSAAGKFLKDAGALPYVEVAWTKSLSTSARGYQWAEKNLPVYANITYVTLKPYGLLAKDLGILGWNGAKNGWKVTQEYVAAKTPAVVNFIEQYAPGLPQKVSDASIAAWKVVSSTASSAYTNGSEFFKTKVFVGNLSPENLQKALNQTQIYVADYYNWFHKKVDVYAKIK